ncbi:uncharacterized protein LOC142065161 isoform X2 [Phalacrocorax aristotelis]|uniref:uncharacterized protein LOC142065161 isoform X2 n=1 Tax=Phalacrocorax aristotelis TaxID=126867 RepID=UPI003F4AFEBB
MDSLHFTWLCFLLLTIAAPCPNIAMPSGNPDERMRDSSSGKTNVTVYHCKGCKSNVCESSNYEEFVKIGETQSEVFSNEILQLVTKETHIKMCFQQENTSEGFYAIFWEKPMGAGDACNYLDLTVSSENVGGNIQICCEAKTDISVPNSRLNCYPEAPDEKTRPSTAYTTGDLGDLPLPNSKKSSIGIITPVVIVGVCAAALAIWWVLQKQNGQGPVLMFRQIFNGRI